MAPLALAVLLVWIAYFIARLLFRGNQHPVIKALVGGLILIVALHIPWLNIAVWLAMVFLGFGAQLLAIYDRRPWRRVPPTPGVSDVEQPSPSDSFWSPERTRAMDVELTRLWGMLWRCSFRQKAGNQCCRSAKLV